jgi:pyrroline-5-carboxylate reductase
MAKTIVLVGCGRMGSALLKGWLAGGIGPVIVVEPKPPAALKALARKKAVTLVAAPSQVTAKRIAACVVAMKPQILKTEAGALKQMAEKGAVMISIAAGTTLAAMAKAWGRKARIVRAMPNTPGAIGAGITGLYAPRAVSAADRKLAAQLLSALGQTVWVSKEGLIDAVTAVSGSGPAYLFLMAEALTEAGVKEGLPRAQAEQFARATVAGAGALLAADKSPAADLRQAVTSPGGTTAAALAVLMPELPGLMRRAVHAAKKRARELR